MSQSITKALSKMLTAVFVFSVIASSLPVIAAESKNSIDDLKKIQNNIREKDPQKIQSEKLTKKNKDVQVSNQKDLDIEIDSSTKQIRVKNAKKGNTTIGIPNGEQLTDVQTIDNQVIFSNKNAKFDVVAEALDGGVRQVINIKDSSAPTEYDFPISLDVGEKIVVNEDGSAMVTTPLSEKEKAKREELVKTAPAGIIVPMYDAKFSVAKPWARDANGTELRTYYTVSGSNLRQTIETKDAVFPVVADPGYCSQYIVSNDYVLRNYYQNQYRWMYEVLPTYCGKASYAPTNWDEWNEVTQKDTSPSPLCDMRCYGTSTYWSLYNQYMCHSDWINLSNVVGIMPGTNQEYRDRYHLEAWRLDKVYWSFVANKCNGDPNTTN